MRVHHLNCMTTRAPAHGKAGVFERAHFAAHCLLIESDDGLVLVDSGLGLGDVADPEQRLSPFFLRVLKPEFRADMTAVRQIERMGFRSADVRDIVLTHLDFDTAGGLDDFPRARVHLLTRERDFAALQRTWLDRQRFRPQQWSTRNHWVTYTPDDNERWMGLPCVRHLCGLPPEVLLVPLAGHTLGHTGVAIQTEGGWLLHAGDAFFDPRELDTSPRCRTGLRSRPQRAPPEPGAPACTEADLPGDRHLLLARCGGFRTPLGTFRARARGSPRPLGGSLATEDRAPAGCAGVRHRA